MTEIPSRYFIGLSSFEILAWFRRGLFYAYLSIYLRHYLGLSVTETTLFATLPMVVNILGQMLVWGRLSDRLQKRRTLIIVGEVMAGAGTLLVWYVHRLVTLPIAAGYVIIVGLSIIEIFWSMSNIAWSALISDIYKESDRSRIQGRLSSLGGVGRMIGIWIGGLLYDGLGLEFNGWGFYQGALFFVASGAMWISTIPLFFLPEGGANTVRVESETTDCAQVARKRFVLFLTAMVFVNFGRNSIAVIISQYLTLPSGFNVGSQQLSYIINIQSLAMILFGWLVGSVSNRIRNDSTLLIATGIAIGALLLLASADSMPAVYLSSFLRGSADVFIMATSYTMASELISAVKRGTLFSLFNATFFLSWGLAGTVITGPLIDVLIRNGAPHPVAYQASIYTAAAITAIGLLMLLCINRQSRSNR